MLDEADVRARLRQMVEQEGLSALSARLGLSPSFMCHVKAGRRAVPQQVLDELGVERVVQYRRTRIDVEDG